MEKSWKMTKIAKSHGEIEFCDENHGKLALPFDKKLSMKNH